MNNNSIGESLCAICGKRYPNDTGEFAYIFCSDECFKEYGQLQNKWAAESYNHSFHNRYTKTKIPETVRWEVMERDNFTCQICGSRKYLAIDHIIPEVKGGKIEISNLQTLCKSCNSRKGVR
jgi:5-methylcytosine-specific restriction endonuclease McrA